MVDIGNFGNKNKARWLRLSKTYHLPFSKSTLYKWHSKGLYPNLFSKVKGTLFINLDRLEELIDGG